MFFILKIAIFSSLSHCLFIHVSLKNYASGNAEQMAINVSALFQTRYRLCFAFSLK